jgi:hypothetical protein
MSVTAPESGALPPSSLVEFPKAKRPRAKRPTARDMLAISERGARRQGHQFDQLTALMRDMSAKWQTSASTTPTVQHVYNAPVVVINIAHDASPDALRALGEGLRNSNATLALQGQNVSSGELKNVSPVQVDSARRAMDVPISTETRAPAVGFDAKAHAAYGILSEQLAILASFYEKFFQFNLMEWLAQHPGFEQVALEAHDQDPGLNRLIIIPPEIISCRVIVTKVPYTFSGNGPFGLKTSIEKYLGEQVWGTKLPMTCMWTRDTLLSNPPLGDYSEGAVAKAVAERNALPSAEIVEAFLHDFIMWNATGKHVISSNHTLVFPRLALDKGKIAGVQLRGDDVLVSKILDAVFETTLVVSPVNRFTVASATK